MGLPVFVADKMLFLKIWLCSWDQVIPISIPTTLILILYVSGYELKFYWWFGFVLCKSVILLWKTMTLWFVSIPDVQNMTNLVNPVGKIEKPLLDATTCPVFGVCIDFPFGINLGIWWRQSPIHMLHLKPAHHMSLLKRQTSFPNWERLDMSTTCFSILFYHQKITTTRSGATHRKDASDELFGFVLDEERWGFCLGSGGVDKLDKP